MKRKAFVNDNASFICKCIRCREVKGRVPEESIALVVREYDGSGGAEYFISYESQDLSVIYGFLRLRCVG
jgi:histone acetyltransferase (RNA polymerase elongator complex component)